MNDFFSLKDIGSVDPALFVRLLKSCRISLNFRSHVTLLRSSYPSWQKLLKYEGLSVQEKIPSLTHILFLNIPSSCFQAYLWGGLFLFCGFIVWDTQVSPHFDRNISLIEVFEKCVKGLDSK